jgi:hypothetical protein
VDKDRTLFLQHIFQTGFVPTIWLAHTLTVRYTASYVDLEILGEHAMESKDASHTDEKPQRKTIVLSESSDTISHVQEAPL